MVGSVNLNSQPHLLLPTITVKAQLCQAGEPNKTSALQVK